MNCTDYMCYHLHTTDSNLSPNAEKKIEQYKERSKEQSKGGRTEMNFAEEKKQLEEQKAKLEDTKSEDGKKK